MAKHAVKKPSITPAPATTNKPSIQTPDHYLRLATAQTDPTLRAHFQLEAAQAYTRGQAFDKATDLLNTINLDLLNPSDKIHYQLVLAELALANNRPVDALEILQTINSFDITTQPITLQIGRDKLLAASYEAFGQALESIKIRLDLALLLNNSDDEKSNKRAIWALSQQLSDDTLNQLAQNYSQPTLRGWAELTLISRQNQNDPQKLNASLQDWRAKYPNHPANALLANIVPAATLQPFVQPKTIAVILPLQGPLSAQADAIWQGILYAYYESPVESRPTLLLYDSSKTTIPAIYDAALAQNVDFVLGPLTKDQVLLARKNPKIMTLTLNYSGQTPVKNTYEFGLNLTQDTAQLAQRMPEDNLPNVLTITGDDPNSLNTLNYFKQKLNSLGGKVVGSLKLNPKTDLNLAIPALLEFDAKSKTHRQDSDAIFINLTNEQAKTVISLLHSYGIDDLPIYATSLVNNTQSSQNDELNNVIFVDIPFVINPDNAALKAQQTFAHFFTDNYKNYGKLYAVGMDAYHLVFELSRLRVFPDSAYNGSTGVLSLDKNQQIYHELSWGQFVKGDVTAMPARPAGIR